MLKLNLGCGNKIYEREGGWVNVDVIEPNIAVDIIGDITNDQCESGSESPKFHQSLLQELKYIDDEVADEVHAYHVIEHFYRSEVPEVLKEWKRVLKPNGLIVLEQPDILKCAANFLTGMTRGDNTLIHNMGILGFYGDGTPEEPYMGHKWGWFPETLANELVNAGFVDVKLEQAKTHMRDLRDFRLEARRKGDK